MSCSGEGGRCLAKHSLTIIGRLCRDRRVARMAAHSSLSRRSIIRQFALGIASSVVNGTEMLQRVLAASGPVSTTGTLSLRVSDYPALSDELGSVRLDAGLDKPVIINRSDGFNVLSAYCQHNGCTVNRFDPDLGVMRCPCHGSRYNIDGSLNQGPALRGLDKFAATFDGNDTLTITLPGLLHAARSITVVSVAPNSRRLRLTFHARIFTTYQVLYQSTLQSPAQVAPFALTPDGTAMQTEYRNTVFNANDPLPEVALYVDAIGARGFYSIALLPVET